LNNGDAANGGTTASKKFVHFYFNHLPRLTTRPEHIRQFKQVVIDLGVSGKLTRQSLDEKLMELTAPCILEGLLPYPVPKNWVIAKLGDLVDFIGGSQPPKSQFIYEQREGYTRLVQIRDFKSDSCKTYVPSGLVSRQFLEDDVMIGRYGPPVFQILRGLSGAYNVALMKAAPKEPAITNDYLFYLLQESRIHDQVVKVSERTAGQTGIRKDLLNSFEIALPPIPEQQRIVTTIKELQALCDKLEIGFADANAIRRSLLDATLHEALNSTSGDR
jgi:type I restriction enzyme, S subunit